jgi:oxalate decarboxylase
MAKDRAGTAGRLALGLALSALAGFVDAVGVLTLGGLFVAFMSGNTTRLGIELLRGDPATLGFGAVVGAFVAGASAGELLRAAAGPRIWLPALLATEAGLLAVAAAMQDAAPAVVSGLPLAVAMGLQNLARQPVAGAQAGATFVTGSLVGLGQALAAAALGRRDPAIAIHALSWAALLGGIAAGAAAVAWLGPGPALGLPTVLLLAVAATVARIDPEQ